MVGDELINDKLVSKARRVGTGGEGDLFLRLMGYDEKYAMLSFASNYGGGISQFRIKVEPADYESILRTMMAANPEITLLAIGKMLSSTYAPKRAKRKSKKE